MFSTCPEWAVRNLETSRKYLVGAHKFTDSVISNLLMCSKLILIVNGQAKNYGGVIRTRIWETG